MDLNFTDEELMKMVKKKMEVKIDEYVDGFEIDDEYMEQFVEDAFTDKFSDTPNGLEDHLTKVAKGELVRWMEQNIGDEELVQICRDALLEKMKDFTFEQVKELFTVITK